MKQTILIVEDNATYAADVKNKVNQLLQRLNLSAQFIIKIANNYNEALQECLAAKIIILDNDLRDPQHRGADLIPYIRNHPTDQPTFIIGNSSAPSSFRGLALDAILTTKNSLELTSYLENFLQIQA